MVAKETHGLVTHYASFEREYSRYTYLQANLKECARKYGTFYIQARKYSTFYYDSTYPNDWTDLIPSQPKLPSLLSTQTMFSESTSRRVFTSTNSDTSSSGLSRVELHNTLPARKIGIHPKPHILHLLSSKILQVGESLVRLSTRCLLDIFIFHSGI